MKQKKSCGIDKIFAVIFIGFFCWIAFMAIEAEGFIGGLMVLGKIFGMALASMLALVIVWSLMLWMVFSYRRRRRCKKIEREIFSQAAIENPRKKKGYHPECPGPNKWAR